MAETYLVMPLTIIRGTVFEDYLQIPDASGFGGQDLTGYTLLAEVRSGNTLLATLTCTPNTPPPGTTDSQGWVQIRLDDSEVIPAGYYKASWALLASADAENPAVIAAGPVEIYKVAAQWV